jgi:hypothetical protein
MTYIRQSWRLAPFTSMNVANPRPGVNRRCMAVKEYAPFI